MSNLTAFKNMNRKERRASKSKTFVREAEKNEKRAERNKKTLEKIYGFLTSSIDDPEKYIKTSNRIYLLRCIGNIMDSVLSDIDGVMHLSDFDEPSKKLMRKINTDLDTLLTRLRDYSMKTFGDERVKDGFLKDDEYDDLCKVSYSLQDLMELYLIYFIDPEDHWRLAELDKFVENVVSKDAMEVKKQNTREQLERLYGEKLKQIKQLLEK